MTKFKAEDSLGAQPLDVQVKYLLDIEDFGEAKIFVNDMIKFAPQLKNMRDAISAYIANEKIPYEDRLDVWLRTPDCLATFADHIGAFDDSEVEKAIPDWLTSGEFNRREEVDVRYMYFDEEQLEGVEMLLTENFEIPKVIVDMCLKEGIHGFTFDW